MDKVARLTTGREKSRPLSVSPTTGLPDTSESQCPEERRPIEIVQIHSQ